MRYLPPVGNARSLPPPDRPSEFAKNRPSNASSSPVRITAFSDDVANFFKRFEMFSMSTERELKLSCLSTASMRRKRFDCVSGSLSRRLSASSK